MKMHPVSQLPDADWGSSIGGVALCQDPDTANHVLSTPRAAAASTRLLSETFTATPQKTTTETTRTSWFRRVTSDLDGTSVICCKIFPFACQILSQNVYSIRFGKYCFSLLFCGEKEVIKLELRNPSLSLFVLFFFCWVETKTAQEKFFLTL